MGDWLSQLQQLDPEKHGYGGKLLKYNGYATSWFGKDHNTPDWESSVAGPFDRWPTGLGFDYFYGFIGGETHQYYPVLFENTTAVEPDKSPEEGYHLMTDMSDRAINWLRYNKAIAPQKPVLLYFAPGAAHAPHHTPKEWREKYKGQFDAGWEAVREATFKRQLELGIIPPDTTLTEKPDWVEPWESLSADQKKLYARFFENFAGYLSFADHECGRLLDAISELPDADNTLIFYIVGDNGASSEGGMTGTVNEVMNLNGVPSNLQDNLKMLDEIGGPDTEPHYPVGWAWCGNSPFQWVKQVASHFGGTRNPMVVSWPKRIKEAGGIRSQFTHLIDIVPTILDVAGLPAPKAVDGIEQKPMDGVSIATTFDDAKAKPVRQRQYFEVFTNRAIYDNGWIACAQHTLPWRQDLAPGNWDKDKWELYNIDEDFSESNDMAAAMPKKLAEMRELFDEEAEKNNVYPFDTAALHDSACRSRHRVDRIRTERILPITRERCGCRRQRRQTRRTARIESRQLSRCQRREVRVSSFQQVVARQATLFMFRMGSSSITTTGSRRKERILFRQLLFRRVSPQLPSSSPMTATVWARVAK